MSIHLTNEQHQQVKTLLDQFDRSTNVANFTMSTCLQTQGDISKASGLNTTTLRAIREGQRPTKAQQAALKFALIKRLMNL